MKINYSILTLILCLSLYSCNNDVPVEYTIDKSINTKALPIDYCTDTRAVLDKSAYNTIDGEATLYVLVPDGHKLYLKKQTEKSVSFITRGKDVSSAFYIAKVFVKDLAREQGARLNVDLEIIYTGQDLCGTRARKKKNSVVDGSPK